MLFNSMEIQIKQRKQTNQKSRSAILVILLDTKIGEFLNVPLKAFLYFQPSLKPFLRADPLIISQIKMVHFEKAMYFFFTMCIFAVDEFQKNGIIEDDDEEMMIERVTGEISSGKSIITRYTFEKSMA